MGRLFKTFWTDNKLFILIFYCVFLGITLVVPSGIIGIANLSEFGNTFSIDSSNATNGILAVFLTIGFWLTSGLLAPGLAIFIVARTTMGKSRVRFAVIRATKIEFACTNLLLYLIGIITLHLTTFLSFFFLSFVFQADLSWYDFIKTLYSNADMPILISLFSQFFLGILTNFFYWQTMFIAPQTRLFKKIPTVGGIFSLIGIYLGIHTLQMLLSVYFIFSQFENSVYLNLGLSVFISLLFITSYFYLLIKEYEL